MYRNYPSLKRIELLTSLSSNQIYINQLTQTINLKREQEEDEDG